MGVAGASLSRWSRNLKLRIFIFLAMGATDKQLIVIIRITFVKVNLSTHESAHKLWTATP